LEAEWQLAGLAAALDEAMSKDQLAGEVFEKHAQGHTCVDTSFFKERVIPTRFREKHVYGQLLLLSSSVYFHLYHYPSIHPFIRPCIYLPIHICWVIPIMTNPLA
jgi:hypothetical protein